MSILFVEVNFLKVVVTGGAGFIGSHLSKRLLQSNIELTIIDNLHPYYDIEIKKQQLINLKKYGNFTFYPTNLISYEDTYKIFRDQTYDMVIHLAALPGVTNSLIAPLDYIDYDIKATVNILKAAGETGVKHVVFASSSSVYGNQNGLPLKEHMANGRVISPYAASKYGAESFCHAYCDLYGFQLSILRFFTVYGPGGRPDMAISKFISLLNRNEEITVFGEDSARDYTYIDDIVDGIVKVINYSGENEIFNLGSSKPISMKELLRELRNYYPHIKIKHEPFRKGDVLSTWADISKAKKLLQFEPKVSFHDGIKRTVNWAKRYGY